MTSASTKTPLRVVQWTTGIVGSSALRSVLDDPRLELVGVFAHGAAKVGQDAGVLAGREPVGVIATDDVDVLLGLRPDCVVYMPHWPDISMMERILASGINVVTTARLVNGEHYPDDAGKRLAAAAEAGGATLCGTGMNPMLIPTVALAATGMCKTVRHMLILESLDCAMYGSAGTWEAYGFGKFITPAEVHDDLLRAEPDYFEMLDAIARSMDVELDDHVLTVELATADADRDLGYMHIPKGSMSGLDARWIGLTDGREFVELRTVWKLGSIFGHHDTPDWPILHAYKIDVTGDPNVHLKLRFTPEDLADFDVGRTTSMPAVNAIPATVAAAPGVVTPADLTLVAARGAPTAR
jgi:hypothetical protein